MNFESTNQENKNESIDISKFESLSSELVNLLNEYNESPNKDDFDTIQKINRQEVALREELDRINAIIATQQRHV